MSNEIGRAVYTQNEFKKRTNSENVNWKLKEGSNIYRILPPFGTLASLGKWSNYEVIHWGYGVEVDGEKKMRPFRCIQRKNFKTKVVEVECPQCSAADKMFREENSLREKYRSQGKSEEEVRSLLKSFSDWRSLFNTQRSHYVNVLRPDGQLGKLRLSNRAMAALRMEIKNLIDTGEETDPCGVDRGVWLDFFRQGMDTSSIFKVSAVYETVNVNGRNMKSLKPAPLTPELVERMKTEAFDLGTGYKDLTRDQIQILVDSDGDPETVTSIFGAPVTSNTDFNPEDFEDEPSGTKETIPTPLTNTPLHATGNKLTAEDFLRSIKGSRGTL